MCKIDSYIIYNKDVCLVKDIKKDYYKGMDYYILMPKKDDSLTTMIPVNSKNIRQLITREEVDRIISIIPSIEIIECNDRLIENEYKALLKTNKHEDLIKIIKTTFKRNKDRLDNNKKIGEKDNTYFKQAERYLYDEFSIVLNMTFEETKEYVNSEVLKIID